MTYLTKYPDHFVFRLAGCLCAFIPFSNAWELTGYLELETAYFLENSNDSRQDNQLNLSLAIEPELYHEWENSHTAFVFTPFVRYDSTDSQGSHFDVRELNFLKTTDDWEIRIGVGKVFWGVAESQHLVDIINQTDLIENNDGEEKLGQPMVQFSWVQDWGTLDLFWLPYFRERTFPGETGRLRSPPYIETARPIYESSAEEWHQDIALRWSHYWGPFDWGLSYFYGTSREPTLFFDPINQQLQPLYSIIHQFGIDVQYTEGSWLWKWESILREGNYQSHQAFVGGVEYTFFNIGSSGGDLGLIAEYSYHSDQTSSVQFFQNDLFAGTRFAFNNESDTEILAGVFIDLDDSSTSFRLEASHRIGQDWTLAIEAQTFHVAKAENVLNTFRNDSFVQLELRRYF